MALTKHHRLHLFARLTKVYIQKAQWLVKVGQKLLSSTGSLRETTLFASLDSCHSEVDQWRMHATLKHLGKAEPSMLQGGVQYLEVHFAYPGSWRYMELLKEAQRLAQRGVKLLAEQGESLGDGGISAIFHKLPLLCKQLQAPFNQALSLFSAPLELSL